MLRSLLPFSLLLFSWVLAAPAYALYQCASGTAITYSDQPCSTGKATDLGEKSNHVAQQDVAQAKARNAQEKTQLRQLENVRHKQEAQEEKQQQQTSKFAASKKKKCASLAQKKKWSTDDAAAATGKKVETAKRKARRAAEKYALECAGK